MSDALVVVDVQQGFNDPSWGSRNTPACEENVARLITAWRERGEPVVFVRHESQKPDSPLRRGAAGHAFKPCVTGTPDLLVTKRVHSAFHGDVDLDAWLTERGIEAVTICGIQTNMCCETTARLASDLGYRTTFVLDATHTFDLPEMDAETLSRATAATLRADFATVTSTDALLGS
jgi:nicotinamidase-related amidase